MILFALKGKEHDGKSRPDCPPPFGYTLLYHILFQFVNDFVRH